MAFLTWSEQLSVHVKSMDQQHRSLIDLVNQLHAAMSVGKGNEVMAQVLTSLIGYTRLHFTAEEKLMQVNGFPGLAAHKAEHEALTRQVLDVQKQVQSGRTAVSIQLLNFLKQWLTQHIQKTDAQYGAYLAARGIAA